MAARHPTFFRAEGDPLYSITEENVAAAQGDIPKPDRIRGHAARLLYFAIAGRARGPNGTPGVCTASWDTLAEDTLLSRQTVRRTLRVLEALGILIPEKARGCATTYQFDPCRTGTSTATVPVPYRHQSSAATAPGSAGTALVVVPVRHSNSTSNRTKAEQDQEELFETSDSKPSEVSLRETPDNGRPPKTPKPKPAAKEKTSTAAQTFIRYWGAAYSDFAAPGAAYPVPDTAGWVQANRIAKHFTDGGYTEEEVATFCWFYFSGHAPKRLTEWDGTIVSNHMQITRKLPDLIQAWQTHLKGESDYEAHQRIRERNARWQCGGTDPASVAASLVAERHRRGLGTG